MSRDQLYKGSYQTMILELLRREGEMYGYEITQKIKVLSKSGLAIKEGALYPTLHKLEASGLLTTTARRVDNRVRKYYDLTPQGHTETANRLQDLKDFLADIEAIISPKTQPKLA
jgi:DNA-binding PadR family transcriptional regulator